MLLAIHGNVHHNLVTYPLTGELNYFVRSLTLGVYTCQLSCMLRCVYLYVCCMHVRTYTYAYFFTKGQVQIEYIFHHLEKEGIESLVAIKRTALFYLVLIPEQ